MCGKDNNKIKGGVLRDASLALDGPSLALFTPFLSYHGTVVEDQWWCFSKRKKKFRGLEGTRHATALCCFALAGA